MQEGEINLNKTKQAIDECHVPGKIQKCGNTGHTTYKSWPSCAASLLTDLPQGTRGPVDNTLPAFFFVRFRSTVGFTTLTFVLPLVGRYLCPPPAPPGNSFTVQCCWHGLCGRYLRPFVSKRSGDLALCYRESTWSTCLLSLVRPCYFLYEVVAKPVLLL